MDHSSSAPLRVSLVGAGRVGIAVATFLQRGGGLITGVYSRSSESAERSRRWLGVETSTLEAAVSDAEIVLIGAPGSALEEIVGALTGVVPAEALVLHFDGSLGADPLVPLVTRGALGAATHPVQTCPTVEAALARLPGSAWGVTAAGEATARRAAETKATELIRRELRGAPVPVAERDRPLWHAAAVLASNGVSALMAAGEALLESIGIEAPPSVLGPLAAGSIANATEGGGGAATLTGPIARGEVETLRRHLDAIEAKAPGSLDAYAAWIRIIVASARASGRIEAERADALEAVVGAR